MNRPLRWLFGPLIEEMRMASLAQPQEFMFEAFGSSTTLAGETVSVHDALCLADVFAAVNLIGEAVGSLPLKIYRDFRNSDMGEGIEEAPDHRCWRLLHDMPNPYTPAGRFWSTVAVHQLLWGNWFIEKLRDESGLVAELRIIHPSRAEVFYNELAGDKYYRITRMTGEQFYAQDDRILHGFGVSQDGLVGMSPIQQSRESLGIVKARQRFEGEAYGQHPYASGLIRHPGTVKDPKRIREQWRAIYGKGTRDRGGIGVLDEGAEFQELSMPFADMQFVESSHMSKTQIANIFKLPPSYIGGSVGDSLTYATVESNRIWLATQTLQPLCANIAAFLSRDMSLFPFQSWHSSFDMSELLRGDSTARANYYEKGLKNGWLLLDEVRAAEHLPPLPPDAEATAALKSDPAALLKNLPPADDTAALLPGAPAPPPLPPVRPAATP